MDILLQDIHRLHKRGPNCRGLAVDGEGVALGPHCVLLRRTPLGYRSATRGELARILDQSFGETRDAPWLEARLASIAKALDAGELAKAQLLGLYLNIPALDDAQLQRLARATAMTKGYDPDEPRDERGRWTIGGGAFGPAGQMSSRRKAALLAAFRASLPEAYSDAAYQGLYHDFLVRHLAEFTISAGGVAVMSVPLVGVNGMTAVADMIVRPAGWNFPFIVEVKTGNDPTFTSRQAAIYPLAQIGNHVTSMKPGIEALGLTPGKPFPPLPVLIVRTDGPGEPLRAEWLPPPEYVP